MLNLQTYFFTLKILPFYVYNIYFIAYNKSDRTHDASGKLVFAMRNRCEAFKKIR